MRKITGRFAALACVALLLAGQQDAVAKQSGAAAYIESVGHQALATISDKALSKDKKQATLEKIFKGNLDFEWVAKFVMGRFWKQATDVQKKRYLAAYTEFLTKNYTARFSDYTSGSFNVTGERPLESGESVVSMEIVSSNQGEPPILIDYKVRKSGGSFKVFDIIVEGVSLLTTQRSEFGSVLNKSGIDGLIAQLEAK